MGAIPISPTVFITHLECVFTSLTDAIIKEIVNSILKKVKEMEIVFNVTLAVLIGNSGELGKQAELI